MGRFFGEGRESLGAKSSVRTIPGAGGSRPRCSVGRSVLHSVGRSVLRGDDGYTLVEFLIVSVMLGLVLSAIMGPLVFSQKQGVKDIEYSHTVSDATAGLQRMMLELRNAYRINATNGGATGTGSMVDFDAYLTSNGAADTNLDIEYSCAQPSPTKTGFYACERVQAQSGSSLPSFSGCRASGGSVGGSGCAVIIDRIAPSNGGAPSVFTFNDASGAKNSVYPTYIQASVQLPASGTLTSGFNHYITLNNGTTLPNLSN